MKTIGAIVLMTMLAACSETAPTAVEVLVPVSAAERDSAMSVFVQEMENSKPSECGVVRGKIFGDASSNVNGFDVTLTNGSQSWRTRTGQDGRFTLRVDAPGAKLLKIRRELSDSLELVEIYPTMGHIMTVELRGVSEVSRVYTYSSFCFPRPD